MLEAFWIYLLWTGKKLVFDLDEIDVGKLDLNF